MEKSSIQQGGNVVFSQQNSTQMELTIASDVKQHQQHPNSFDVIVVGAGVIGVSSAYFLAALGARVAVIERTGVASAASGKAGGFLALDWCDGGPLEELARMSFNLHDTLAKEFNNPWEYRRLRTISVNGFAGSTQVTKNARTPWLDGASSRERLMGTTQNTAQVTPGKLVQTLMDSAIDKGAVFIMDEVTGLEFDKGAHITNVILSSKRCLCASKVLLAMGPWVHQARQWMHLIPDVKGEKAHSIVIKPEHSTVDGTAVFIDYADKGKMENPEIYPRPDGSVYICGCGDRTPVPATAADVKPSEGKCEKLHEIACNMVSQLQGADVLKQQACYLPTSPDGIPILGELPSHPGVFLATGHSCWGILNGPGTGKVMAELILGHKPSINLEVFSPARFY
eukprot:gene5786-7282_t